MAAPADGLAAASRPWWRDGATRAPAAALVIAAAVAWMVVVRDAVAAPAGESMSMHPAPFSAGGAASFVGAWGVMMAAMMLPSAIPMVALHHTVDRAMTGHPGRRLAPTAVFVAPYLLVWLATGLPVYAASALASAATRAHDWMAGLEPYAVAAVLAGAGVYQLSAAKRVCLRSCRNPLDFLARRWQPGLAGAARVGLAHAGYCLGCCWALMAVLVAAGAMGLAWVVLIAALVLAEKLLRYGEGAAWTAGMALIGLGLAMAIRPDLAGVLAG